MFELGAAWVLLVLPLPLLVYFKVKPVKQRMAAATVPFYTHLVSMQQHSHTQRYHSTAKLLLLALIWSLVVVAAARPQWVGKPQALPTSGRDLLLAVDISDSMNEQDMQIGGQAVSRIAVVKHVVSEFIKRRKGDRIGLVLFGSEAYLQAPLTFDTTTVSQFLQEAQLGFAGPQTAIGDAIGLSVKRFQNHQKTSNTASSKNNNHVIVLLTDGANTSGEVEPLQAAKLAQQTQTKIYTIGMGADEMVVRGFFGPRRVNPSASLDEETLTQIANTTNGKYFRARDTKELDTIYTLLDALEPIVQDEQWLRPTTSLFLWPLAAALLIGLLWCLYVLLPQCLASVMTVKSQIKTSTSPQEKIGHH